ncbi:MAG: glycosyltransferase family 9 protein, partial [Endomicrobiia bacterium]
MRGNKLVKYIDIIFGIPLLIFFSLFKIFKIKKDIDKINKILLIKLSALGDTILLIPVIRTLKENYPDSKISMVVTEINKSIAERCDYIDNIFDFKPEKFIKSPLKLLKFIKKIRNEKFDLVIDADQWLRISAILSFLSGAKKRIGFKTKGQFKHFSFTDIVLHKRYQHEIECFFDLIKPLKLQIKNKSLEFNINEDKIKEAENLLKSIGINNEKFIIIHPEVPKHGFQRQWPSENFVKLIEEILRRYNIKILITGTKRTSYFVNLFSNEIKENIKFVFDTEIGLLSAIISKSLLIVCNNTGIMHLACAVGIPVIALHGPTDPIKWG